MNGLSEKELNLLNRGRTSAHLLHLLTPTIEGLSKNVVGRMKAMYLSGNATESMLLACVAELCALDSLVNNLKMESSQVDHLSKKMDHTDE